MTFQIFRSRTMFYNTKNRQKFKHKSGGVAIYVKKDISKHMKVVENSHDNTLFIVCNEAIIGFKFLLCAVYIPPESSKYSSIDLFDQLEEELLEFSAPYTTDKIRFTSDNLPLINNGGNGIYYRWQLYNRCVWTAVGGKALFMFCCCHFILYCIATIKQKCLCYIGLISY